jgi:hypothetical protein
MKKTICLILCALVLLFGGCAKNVPTAETTTGETLPAADDASLAEEDAVDLPDDLPVLPDSFVMNIPDMVELSGDSLRLAMRLGYNAALWCASQNGMETAYSEDALIRLQDVNVMVTDSMFDGQNGVVILEYPTGMHQADYYYFTTHDRAKSWAASGDHAVYGLQLLGMQYPYVYATITSDMGGGLRVSADGGAHFTDVALFDLLPSGTVGEDGFCDGTIKDFRISEEDGTIRFDLFGFNIDDPSETFRFVLDQAAETCISCSRTEDTVLADEDRG